MKIERKSKMKLSTLNTLPEATTVETIQPIFSQYSTGINILKDIQGGIKALLGKRTSHYEADIENARSKVLEDLTKQAETLGGNAILGVSFQYSQLVDTNITILTVYGTGTVVSYSREGVSNDK